MHVQEPMSELSGMDLRGLTYTIHDVDFGTATPACAYARFRELLPRGTELRIVFNRHVLPETDDVLLSHLGVDHASDLFLVIKPATMSKSRLDFMHVLGRLAAAPYRIRISHHRRDGAVTARTEFLTEEQLMAAGLDLDAVFGSADELRDAMKSLFIRYNPVWRTSKAGDTVKYMLGVDGLEKGFARQPDLTLHSLLAAGHLMFEVHEAAFGP